MPLAIFAGWSRVKVSSGVSTLPLGVSAPHSHAVVLLTIAAASFALGTRSTNVCLRSVSVDDVCGGGGFGSPNWVATLKREPNGSKRARESSVCD